jgi:hypothetical protein
MSNNKHKIQRLQCLLADQADPQSKNLLTTLTLIRHERIFTDSELGRLLSHCNPTQLKEAQAKLARYAHRFGYAKSSIPTYRSRLKKLVEFYHKHIESVAPAKTETIGHQILWHVRQSMPQSTQRDILDWTNKHSQIPVATLKRWITSDSQPSSQHFAGLTELARTLNLEDNYFTERHSATYLAMRAVVQATKQAEARQEQPQSLPKLPEFPDAIQQQLSALLVFKTKARAPVIHQASFTLKRRDAPALVGGGRWTSTPDGVTSSANNFTQALDRYFRWVLANQPITVAQLDLSLLCTVELLEMYVDASLEYELYGTLLAFLAPLSGLCDPDSGYLVRYHAPKKTIELASGHVTEAFDKLSDWQDQARYLSQQVKSWIKDARHLHREGSHDTEDSGRKNINWLLDRPEASLADSVDDLRLLVGDLMQVSHTEKSRLSEKLKTLATMQVGVWLALSLEVPLRISNWTVTEFFDKQPPADVKAPVLWYDSLNANYRLRVPRGWLKNRRGRETEQIDTIITHEQTIEALNALKAIRQELNLVRPSLFVQTRNSVKRAIGEPYHRTAFAKAIQTWTGRFAFARWQDRGITNGINPHALRHFVASYVLEQTGDFRLAATSLMDSVAVVISVYGKNDHTTNQRKLVAMQNQAN